MITCKDGLHDLFLLWHSCTSPRKKASSRHRMSIGLPALIFHGHLPHILLLHRLYQIECCVLILSSVVQLTNGMVHQVAFWPWTEMLLSNLDISVCSLLFACRMPRWRSWRHRESQTKAWNPCRNCSMDKNDDHKVWVFTTEMVADLMELLTTDLLKNPM